MESFPSFSSLYKNRQEIYQRFELRMLMEPSKLVSRRTKSPVGKIRTHRWIQIDEHDESVVAVPRFSLNHNRIVLICEN